MARKLSAVRDGSRPRRLRAAIKAAVLIGWASFALGCEKGGAAAAAASAAASFAAPPDPSSLPFPQFDRSEPIPASAPMRIVSVIPSVTETLFALGLGDRVVARSDWCDYPPEVATRPSVGRQESLSPERIADLKPDVVFAWAHLPDARRLLVEVFGLKVVAPGTETKDEVFAGIAAVAEACGVPLRGAALVAAIRAGLERARATYAGRPRRRTLVVLDRNPLFAPGRSSFVDEMLDLVGADNVAAEPGGKTWVSFSAEKVFDWRPETIVDLSLGSPEAAGASAEYWARFAGVPAVDAGRVRRLAAGVIVRPGPRMAAVADLLGKLVHDD